MIVYKYNKFNKYKIDNVNTRYKDATNPTTLLYPKANINQHIPASLLMLL